jgi:tetratricopeptide (TPR) repeat protein
LGHGRISFDLPFLKELQRRNVVRVASLYLAICWLILEPVHVIFHMLEVPVWANRLVLLLMALGFPAVVIFAWVYEITPEGLKPTEEVPHGQSIRRQTGQRLNLAIIAVLALAAGYLVVTDIWLRNRLTSVLRPRTEGTSSAWSSKGSSSTKLVPVAPYSQHDRRMTFALLPLEASPDASDASKVAKATTTLLQSRFELNNWAHVAARTSIDTALEARRTPRELAQVLGVHFLVKGDLAEEASGFVINLYTVDGDTERELGRQELHVKKGQLIPRWMDDVDGALGYLIAYGLEAEVQRRASQPTDELDVRDLTFRAFATWGHNYGNPKLAYQEASPLIRKALRIAPDDLVALKAMAEINLCECINGWSQHPEEQQASGAAAVDRYLLLRPDDPGMLLRKSHIYTLRGRWDQSLELAERILRKDPDNYEASSIKAESLLKLNRAPEAATIAGALLERNAEGGNEDADLVSLNANIQFALGHYDKAATLAHRAEVSMSEEELRSPVSGTIRLTSVAANAKVGKQQTAAQELADLRQAVPQTQTIEDIRRWMRPNADLAQFEPLFAGLRVAGVPEK